MAVTEVLILEVSSATYQEIRQKLVDLGYGRRLIYQKVISIPEDAEVGESIRMGGIFLRMKGDQDG